MEDSDFIPMMACEDSPRYWGGSWTEQKLDTFEKYVQAYLTIMNAYRDVSHWKLIYFDGFAGSGTRTAEERKIEEEKVLELFGNEKIESHELFVYQGAAERVVKLEEKMRGFDYYYFIDKEEENCTRLELKLSQYPTKGIRQFRPGDANVQTRLLADALRRNKHLKALCFLDPFGMSIDWSTIEAISGTSVDLWILIPSGVIVNRLLRRNGELMHPNILERYFGMSKEDIHSWFYTTRTETDLFEETREWYEKKDNAIHRIAELYCERLGELFPFVTPRPLVMENNHHVPIFHFVCASYNQTAVKIAQQIIDKRQ